MKQTMRTGALLAVILTAALCAIVRPAAAEDYVWRDVKVGGGGYIPNIIFSPVERGLAYLRTDMGCQGLGLAAAAG
jgi:xyloglucan-specific exo-beta-1,4-glucanase